MNEPVIADLQAQFLNDVDLSLYSKQHDQDSASGSWNGSTGNPQIYPSFRPDNATPRSTTPDVGEDCSNGSETDTTRLLRLESRLRRLTSLSSNTSSDGPNTSGSTCLSEALLAAESLANILKHLREQDDELVILHVFICYGYLLRSFTPLATALEDASLTQHIRPMQVRNSSSPAFRLGSFTLEFQPELNARVTSSLVCEMIQNIQQLIHDSVGGLEKRKEQSSRSGSRQDERDPPPSSMIGAARLAVQKVEARESSVVHRLQSRTFAPGSRRG